MSFLVPCPNCGPRDVNEFGYAGEITRRPQSSPSFEELTAYLYLRDNVAGVQREWWYHRLGCQAWFRADRDTRSNEVLATELASPPRGERGATSVPDVPAT
jgi:heterotetrameric sarcosine oxidase delta subunit